VIKDVSNCIMTRSSYNSIGPA